MNDGVNINLRASFAQATYGPAGERCSLARRPGTGPSWARTGQRWAIITAWNPAGQPQARALNLAADLRLQQAVTALGFSFGRGVNGEGEWQEEALLIFALTFRQACGLGQRFGQAAVLCGSGTRAALLWMNGDPAQRFWLVQGRFNPSAAGRYTGAQ